MNANIRPRGSDDAHRKRYFSIMSMKLSIVALRKRGRVLGTRELGAEIAVEVRERIAARTGVTVMDFDGVEIASSPVLDEIACALRAALTDHAGRMVVLTHLNEDLYETLKLVLEHRDMALTTLDEERLRLIGGRKHLEETLAGAQELGTFTAAQLAERLEVKLPNLHARLKQLQAAGAVARLDPSSGSGSALRFAVATADELATA